MAQILDGKQVVEALNTRLQEQVAKLHAKGIKPTLAVVRVGERADDISYERGVTKRCETIGVGVEHLVLPADVEQAELLRHIQEINANPALHGILLFRPLPDHINDLAVRKAIDPAKDVDGVTDESLTGVFTSSNIGFAPATAEACIEVLEHFGYKLDGKHALVVGRSLVVGRPLAMMLLRRHSTVTVCHRHTVDLASLTRQADIILVAVGKAKLIGAEHLKPGQVVIDVGINVDEAGKLCGDVDFAAAEQIVGAITPVPGGIGTVTTSVLVKHVIEAAERQQG